MQCLSIEESRKSGTGRQLALKCLLIGCWIAITGANVHAVQPQQLKLAEVIWGFDGRVVPGQFNPLSLLVDNLSDQPIEGQISIRAVSGLIRDTGGIHSEPLYLSPNTRRWVQFYPYIGLRSGSWRIQISTADAVIYTDSIDQPRSVMEPEFENAQKLLPPTLPAVILDRSGMAQRLPTTVKHMPAEIFPPYSSAMFGLRVLFLDHVPDWETPRQEALLSWLKSGGEVHLLQDSNGRPLVFSQSLAALNEPFPEFTAGSGRVIRHDFQRDQLTEQIVATCTTRPKSEQDELENQMAVQPGFAQHQVDVGSADSELVQGMRRLMQPEHAWWLIFLLSLCYIGLIFPGCWILSQNRRLHYLVTYGAILGLALVFSVLFLLIGRRGYDEDTTLLSLSIARAEDNTHSSLLQWNLLFVTQGNRYSVTSNNEQGMLASGESEESVDALIHSGNEAKCDVRIPPFSSQAVISRRRVQIPDWKVELTSLQATTSDLSGFEIRVGSQFPADSRCRYLVLHRQRLYEAVLSEDKHLLTKSHGLPTIWEFTFDRNLLQTTNQPGTNTLTVGGVPSSPPAADEKVLPPEEVFYEDALAVLVERSLLDDGIFRASDFSLPPDRVRLMVYAPMEESLQIPVNTETKKQGRILHVRDLLLEETSTVEPDSAEKPAK